MPSQIHGCMPQARSRNTDISRSAISERALKYTLLISFHPFFAFVFSFKMECSILMGWLIMLSRWESVSERYALGKMFGQFAR
jgi:xanthine/uracil permease